MTTYLLDTNIVSAMAHDPHGPVYGRIAAAGIENVLTSIIVAAEVRFGLARKRSSRLAQQAEAVLAKLHVVPLGQGVDARYADLRYDLERQGRPIGANDLFIAAHALALGATLVTDNLREFERVEGLALENWLRD